MPDTTETSPTSRDDKATTTRLDRELVTRKYARSRDHATTLIAQGRVFVDGITATKPAHPLTPDSDLHVDLDPDDPEWASRAGGKIAGVLHQFGVHPRGLRCLDAGASHGGFTDVLLRLGAASVAAVDVGHDQLIPRLRADPRVSIYDGVNARSLTPATIGGPVHLVVADLSFISLRLVLPALTGCTHPQGQLVLLVKPQFEAPKDDIGKGGIVHSATARVTAVLTVAATAVTQGLTVLGAAPSPVAGRNGNQEAFLWLRRDTEPSHEHRAWDRTIRRGLAAWAPGAKGSHGA